MEMNFEEEENTLIKFINDINILEITPMEAMTLLDEIKKIAKK